MVAARHQSMGSRCRLAIQDSNRRRSLLSKMLKSCSGVLQITQVHAHMSKSGLDLAAFPASKLLAAAAIVDGQYARSIFDLLDDPCLFNFNTILRGYSVAPNPELHQAIPVFRSLMSRGIAPDQFSYITTLKVCARRSAIGVGEQVLGSAIRHGFDSYLDVRNTLIHFYCCCGRIVEAHQVFDEMPWVRDAVSWNALMGGYLGDSRPDAVIRLFRRMRMGRLEISSASVVVVVSALHDADVHSGALHASCFKMGFFCHLNVASTLLTSYARSGLVSDARDVFDEMPKRDLVMYNCLIDGYAKNGFLAESLDLLNQMQREGVRSNSATIVTVVSSCASFRALDVGRQLHSYAEEEIGEVDLELVTALVDMYFSLDEATEVFDQTGERDVKLWTAMIMGLGVHGCAGDALRLFRRMEEDGVAPNEVTFLAALNACSHGGLVEEGKEVFEKMATQYGLAPKIEHYGCVVDLLSRAGMLVDAREFMERLPSGGGDETVWRALLSACRVNGDVGLGELAARSLKGLGSEQASDSILLRGAYAMEGRWADLASMWRSEGPDADAPAAAAASASASASVKKEVVAWSSIEMVGL